MAGRVVWDGPAEAARVEEGVRKNLRAAAIYLTSVIKADISQPGTLARKGKRSVYNFTHSAPGNPPYMQTGRLRASIAWELAGRSARVGTNVAYGLYLEKGTRKMAARPFMAANLARHRSVIQAILTAQIAPGGLPEIVSNQFRSGLLGAGARKLGYR